ncbi:zinc finger HIT domain-containing protein 1 isoform X3 [Betta splendens]|uniref:Zinc finger HIT domain-containing protein 1 isoform X3 n=1 Tax=Betta splendens TaxID=158456 RepID=A0A6P7LY41_BETSP|nr:zinc finger HIT domain-containing protein 1 isoform X3 [Betta splendens]
MVLEKKASARVEAGQRRVLDEATRQRRLTRQLEALEKDNFQRRRRGRRGATTSSKGLGRTSPHCWKRRICRRRLSLTTCQQRRRLHRCPPVISAASVGSPHTTPVPPAGGATAAASVCVHTERPGV